MKHTYVQTVPCKKFANNQSDIKESMRENGPPLKDNN